jgi:basic membrane protein A
MSDRSGQTRRQILSGLGAAGAVGLAGCSGGDGGGDGGDGGSTESETEATEGMDEVQAAWVIQGPVGDLGWNFAHDDARQKTDEAFDWVSTESSTEVAVSDAVQTMSQYANDGYDVVFGSTFSFQDQIVEAAQNNPDTLFEHCAGYETSDNLSRFFGRITEPRFVSGVAAGMLTESNTIGFVGAFPTPQVIRGLNSVMMGVRQVNEDATMKVRWVNSWNDPPTARESASVLMEEGADVMTQHMNSAAPVEAAHGEGVWAVGFNAPMGQFAEEDYVISPVWSWDAYYKQVMKDIRDGTWESGFTWGGLDSGIVGLDEWGDEVPQDVIDRAEEARTDLENDDLDIWAGSQFEGESDRFLFREMSSYVEGVEGEAPE